LEKYGTTLQPQVTQDEHGNPPARSANSNTS
jgi:hypothetical protein